MNSLGSISKAFFDAKLYPSTTSLGDKPIRKSSSARLSNAPPNINTKLVPSPTL